MRQFRDFAGEPQLPYHAWRALLYANYGRYNPEGIEPAAFVGWVRPLSTNGLTAVDIGCNAPRIERTQRDIRLDGVEHYSVLFQVAGCSAFSQNDRVTRVATNDVVLIDTARPMTCFVDNCVAQWLILICRGGRLSHILDLNRREEQAGAAERAPDVRCSTLFRAQMKVTSRCCRLVTLTSNWRSTILSARCLCHLSKVRSRAIRTSYSRTSTVSWSSTLPIPTSAPLTLQRKQGFRCVTSRSCLRAAARAAANTFIPCVWTTRRVPYVATRYWANTNPLARSHMNAAFATTLISREDFVAGLVVLRAPTLENVINATDTEHDGHRNTMRGAPAVPSTSGNSQLLRRFVA
jgi:AraC-binding-like domain